LRSNYMFGFNGQEKVDEISGTGNHNTALFWEYDTRLGRRWNLDPVDQVNISNYAVNYNNPIQFNDPLGNTGNDPVKVKKGDNLSSIAKSNNTTVDKILKENPEIKDPNKIHPGQKINLPNAPKSNSSANTASSNKPKTQNSAQSSGPSVPTQNSNSGLRMPDFYTLNVSVTIPTPWTATALGWNGTVSIDRHGQIFASPIGIGIGKSATGVSGSLTANWMLQSNKPTSTETYNFLSGHGISVGGGYIGGVNFSISPTNSGTKNAIGIGFYSPQVGVSYNYTPDGLIYNKK
jgi:LysM domain